MSKVADFVLCRSCVNTREAGCSANQIFITAPVSALPAKISFSIVLTFVDIQEKEKIRVSILDETEKKVADISGEIKNGERPDYIPAEFYGLHVTIDFKDIDIKKDGKYKILISDSKQNLIAEKQFFVFLNSGAKGE